MIPNMHPLWISLILNKAQMHVSGCVQVCACVCVCTWEWGLRLTAQSNLPCSVNCLNHKLRCANKHKADTEKHKYLSSEKAATDMYFKV